MGVKRGLFKVRAVFPVPIGGRSLRRTNPLTGSTKLGWVEVQRPCNVGKFDNIQAALTSFVPRDELLMAMK
jgi:hypothetical protein